MKIAVVGSRNLFVSEKELSLYLFHATEIVSGGAQGVDFCAAEYAKSQNIKLTEFLPNYARYGRAAPIVRNKSIVHYADKIIAFWDGKSKGTRSVIAYAEKTNKICEVVLVSK